MFRISKLTDYATLILSYLAEDSSKIASAAHVARETHLSVPTVSKILKMLFEAGLVKSFRGTGGGYLLVRSAKEITLADVISAMEGKLSLTECCSSSSCLLDSLCTVKENWQVINNLILTALAGVTLQDMIRPLTGHALTLRGIPIKVEG